MTAGVMSLTSWEKEVTVSLGRSGKVLGVENIWLGFRVVRNLKSQSKVSRDLLFFSRR